MNINRHNYETIFLLYVDNELSAADRKAVELFVQENTDLGEELVSLLETTLPAETISFNVKNKLYKNEIGEELQENLLLQLDKELAPADAQKIEALIASDINAGNEWKILQQTKLDPNEKIVFENKSILYRHEGSRVIAMRFWRIAAAAAILLLCLFTGITLLKNNKTGDNEIAKGNNMPSTEKQIKNNPVPDNNNAGTNSNTVEPTQTNTPENIASVNDKEKQQEQPNQKASVTNKQNAAQDKNQIASDNKSLKKEKNILPEPSLENINNEESNKTFTASVLDKNNGKVIINKAPEELATISIKEKIKAPSAPIIDYNSVPAISDSYARTTVLNEAAPNDNKILYMNEETVTRSKIGGLFRKVKRVIERNTNIKTGNGIRVAGFEIAVK